MPRGASMHVNADQLYNYASEIDAQKDSLKNVLEELDKSMNNIFNNSEGETIETIHTNYSQVYASFEAFIGAVENYAQTLRNSADQVRQADAQIAKLISFN
ncbi:MAG: WXG100 family type VII secretion target [Lachnospiraceae bacterium]|nr:WXG100 family type VII secretion target [Lachnospiraceae bacterium]